MRYMLCWADLQLLKWNLRINRGTSVLFRHLTGWYKYNLLIHLTLHKLFNRVCDPVMGFCCRLYPAKFILSLIFIIGGIFIISEVANKGLLFIFLTCRVIYSLLIKSRFLYLPYKYL